MLKSKFSNYNDGVLYVVEIEKGSSNFTAVKNNAGKITKCLKLAFCEMSKRDDDLSFAESVGRALSVKVKCRYHQGVDATSRVMIGNTLYSAYKLDVDRSRNEMYIYLEEERTID